jgi:hypothetical protein
MADDGKSIADAYRNWSPDSASAAPSEGASIADAYRVQAAAAPPATTSQKTTPSFGDAYAHTQSVDEYGNVQAPLATAPTPPSSLEDLRDKLQTGEINVLKRMAGGPDAGGIEGYLRQAAAVPVHLAFGAAQLPINALIGLKEGPQGAVTINPETGTLNLTPEAMAATQLLTGSGPAGRDLRFVPRGGNPLEFVPPARPGGPLPPDTAANLLSPDARVRAAETPPGPTTPTGIEPPPPVPVPTTAAPVTEHTPWVSSTTADIQRVLQENGEAGGPTSLGAMAAPEQLAKMTPAQVKANRRVAELNQIVTPIEGEDTTEWVRGSTPTEAERTGTPTTSQKEVMTRQRNPDAFEGPNGQLTINDKARVNAFDETLLSDTQAADLKERQQAAASEAQGRILSTAKPVDLKPAADWIEAKLADPLIQEDKHVYNSLKGLRDQLYDADGNLKTDPRAAWGMHNNLRNKLLDAKDPFSANPSEKYAVTQTNEFKGLVDSALDKASDGQFRTHLDQQAEFLKSLNAWRLLNDFRYGPNKMINGKSGMINGNAFHRFVTDLAIRRGRPGIDAAMDVPDNVMQRLINIDQDLKRAGRIDLGKPRGSPTNLFFELAGALGISGAHALAAAATVGTPYAGIANIGVQAGIGAIQRRLGQRRINRLTEQALQPPPGGLTPPPGNPLQQAP